MLRTLTGLLMTALFIGGTPANYEETIRAWQVHREAGLRKPDGWLTLVGLFWLKDGRSSIGSGENSDFLLPQDAPSQLGIFDVSGNTVTFSRLSDNVTVNSKPVTGAVVLKHDKDDNLCDRVEAGPISFYVMDRDGRMAVRVRDRESKVLKEFKGTEFFPINPEFRFEAKLIEDKKQVPIPNILGKTEMEESPGLVEFTFRGQTYRLRAIYEGKTLFFLFKDPTNRDRTYQAGRMVNTPLPEGDRVILDFNRAYNPPCIFTPYATCPLAPKENILPIRVEAGELRYQESRLGSSAGR